MRYYFVLLLILSCLPSFGYDIVVDNFYYDVDIENQTLSFSGYSSAFNGSEIRIPSSVTYNSRVLPVVGISTNAFKRVGSQSLTIVIPNSILEIKPVAFPYGTKVENVIIEDGDNPIKVGYAHKGALLTTGQEEGKGTFGYCSLNEVYIGRNLDYSEYNTLAYGYTPFYRSTIKKVSFGEKVTTIQASLFCFCYYLTELYLPKSIEEIGPAAFSNCGFTNHFVLPPKITVVEHRTFSASKFQVIDLSSDALTEIRDESFEGRNAGYSSYNGEYTKEIIIGKNVTKIGVAFKQQKDIKKITCYNTEPPQISHTSFVPNNVYLDAILYVPANSVELYKSAYAWNNFWDIKPIEGTSNITGDVNSDGEVNIADINTIINVILSDISNQLADVNNDGEVNIADVNMVIGIILGDSPSSPSNVQTFTVNGVTFKMVAVEGGSFTIGATTEQSNDAYNWEKPTHKVNLSSYRIEQTEVTQELWLAVMGNNPSGAFSGDLKRPVGSVSWLDCQEFIQRLNELTGKTFRLPTEAEWEFAARGGNKRNGYKYAGSNNIDEVAWWGFDSGGNSGYGTNPVATKKPNELGLYDMSGNVFEWCEDWYGSYDSIEQTNPKGPDSGTNRTYRGGSWIDKATYCRVSCRSNDEPTRRYHGLGLRLAL